MTDLIAILAREARQHPDRVVLVDACASLTLGELWQRVSLLGQSLQQVGLGPGDRMALIGANSPAWVQAWLAALAVGAVVVPLNPELRTADQVALIAHAGADVVFIDQPEGKVRALHARIPDKQFVLARPIDGIRHVLLPSGTEPASPLVASVGGDLACILYTSGTTGSPKGVMLSHDSLLQNALDVVDYLGLSEDDAALALLPFYYSFGNSILLTHLLSGARLVFGASMMYPEQLLELVAGQGVTGLYGVPGLFQMLLKKRLLSDRRWDSLRFIAQAGGAMPAIVADDIERALPGRSIFVMYGQTEATARISYLAPEFRRLCPDSVGWPMPDTCIQIRDEAQRLLPAGEVGQVWVRGPGVMLGYWRNSEATKQVLVNGWLNTGDMGELDQRGFLYIRGRRTDMLKVSGQRLHPQEVEAVICELPGIEECAVDGMDDPVAGQVPRAFVVAAADAGITERDVLRHCREQLAGWKIPRKIEMVPALPKTGSGKIQRHRLAEIAGGHHRKLSEGHA